VEALRKAQDERYRISGINRAGSIDRIISFPQPTKEIQMKFISQLLLAVALFIGVIATPALAGDKDPLFIGLSSDSSPRVDHVLHFSGVQMSRGHSLTIWLNESGIFLASKKYSEKHAVHQKALAELMSKGATVLICQYCMKQFDVKESDLLPGFTPGNPDLLEGAIFKDNTKTLTW
jgi:intracellular sulfur oxidation DsrE/DsrF family protein